MPESVPESHSWRARIAPVPVSLVILLAYLFSLVAAMMLFAGVLALAFHLDGSALTHPERVPPLATGLYAVGLTGSLLGLVAFFWRKVLGHPFGELTAGPWRRPVMRGCLFGFLSMGALYGLRWVLGLGGIQAPTGLPWPLLSAIPVAVAFAVSEEIVFRGFFLRTLMLDLPAPAALVVSSYLYAQAHFLHAMQLADLAPLLCLFGIGLLLGQLALRTGRLWTAIGLHSAWVYVITIVGQLGLWHGTNSMVPLIGGQASPTTSDLLELVILLPLAWILRDG